MRTFRKDEYLQKLTAAIDALRERYFSLPLTQETPEAEELKIRLNILAGYRTTYAAHWYDRPEADAPEKYIRLDLSVLLGRLPRTEAELQAALAATDDEGIKRTAMAKHRGYNEVKAIYESCWEEATTAQ